MLGITNLLLAPGQFGIDTSASIRDALALEITQEFDVCRREPLDRTAERLACSGLVTHAKLPGNLPPSQPANDKLHDLSLALSRRRDRSARTMVTPAKLVNKVIPFLRLRIS